MKKIEKIIHSIIKKELNYKKEIKNNFNLKKDLRADSLEIIELTMSIEEKFNIEISDKKIKKMHTIKDIINYITLKKTSI